MLNNVKIGLGLLNIRSILSKYDNVYEVICDGLDILVLTETWHGSSNEIAVRRTMPPGYNFVDFVRPHDPFHGGLIIYFKRCFNFKLIRLPVLKTFETLDIKLKINGTHIVLLAVYRPGSALISSLFFQELVAVLEILSLLSNNVVLAGDFNVHVEKHMDPHSVSLCEIFGNFNLVNRINEPTHELGGVLDLIITSMSFPVFDIRVLPPGVFSDHGLVQACLSIDQVIRMKKKGWFDLGKT
ncbi:hypothetical protein HELRODRAFT_178667 [Helobdella robusta]|uniref:Endonuclease/exonuclease/phosphatase domain-containing protein n=1 Tax=Helobdella robusta TaxID=6412 RepID=T1FDJ2_HELRO|nr:hypothetical protein HELRODRAFT_178667 [Helobdella robusta]ESN96867.1 hypothetical protein HELRODRAFT_178667 [Helobdella robusta]